MRTLRVGVVGAGYIARVHSAALCALAGTYPDLNCAFARTAVVDADRARAEQLARDWGWGRYESSWTAVTRSDDIDVVHVCLPNALHAEVAIDALEHGKHVVCEKPLANDVASARAMASAAGSAATLAQVCFYYRLWPAVAWARSLVNDGAIGEIRHFRGWMLQDYAARAGHELGWRARREDSGAGALGDLGSHIFDIARHLCGDIEAVCASTHELVSRSGEAAGIDDAVTALVHFASGIGGVIEASWAMTGHRCDLAFDLVGSEGAVRFSWERFNEVEVLSGDPGDPANGFRRVLIGGAQPDVERFVAVPGQGLGYRDAFVVGLGHFARAVAEGADGVEPGFADGLRAAELVDAALQSAASRAWVRVGSERA